MKSARARKQPPARRRKSARAEAAWWWGLRRRPPRFWIPKRIAPWEAIYLGSIWGLLLLVLAYLAGLIYWEDAVTLWQLTDDHYFRGAAVIFFLPIAITLCVWAGGLFGAERTGGELDAGTLRGAVRGSVFYLRERHQLRTIDCLFIALILGTLSWMWYQEIPFDLTHEWPLIIGAGVVFVHGLVLRKNAFHPRPWRFQYPEWLLGLLDSSRFRGSSDTVRPRCISPDPEFDVVYQDDLADFTYTLTNALPPAIREVGVLISPSTKDEMRGIQKRAQGALYQRNGFAGTLEMLDLLEGPLKTVGLVEMKRLVLQLKTRQRVAGWSDRVLATHILDMVQREITYLPDEETTGYVEYGRFPLETLADGQGDCECVAILTAALLSYCGIDSALVVLGPGPDENSGHAMAGYKRQGLPRSMRGLFRRGADPAAYLYGEATTSDGGEWNPYGGRVQERLDRIIPIPGRLLIDY